VNRFLFATAIENSYPAIRLAHGQPARVDEMEKTGYHRSWNEDFQLVKDPGVDVLRGGRIVS
jgi:hypothetical protein